MVTINKEKVFKNHHFVATMAQSLLHQNEVGREHCYIGSIIDRRIKFPFWDLIMPDNCHLDSYFTTQLGVEYSSNNAGDGPALTNFEAIVRVTRPYINDELESYYKSPSPFKTMFYRELVNVTYRMFLSKSMTEFEYWCTVLDDVRAASMIFACVTPAVEYKAQQRLLRMKYLDKYKAFLNPDGTIQLGVAYSSNNAGDGPHFLYVLVLVFFVAIHKMDFMKCYQDGGYCVGLAYIASFSYNSKSTNKEKQLSNMMIRTKTEYIMYLAKVEFAMFVFNELVLMYISYDNTFHYLDFLNLVRIAIMLCGRYISFKWIEEIGYRKFAEFGRQMQIKKIVCDTKVKRKCFKVISNDDVAQSFSFLKDVPDKDKKFFESLLWYATSLKRCKNITDIFFASLGFYQMISERSIYSQLAESDFVDYFQKLFDSNPYDETSSERQSIETLRDFRMFLGNYDKIKESEVYCKIKRFIIYTLCKISHLDVGINFQSCGYTKLEEVTLRRKHSSNVDFVYILLDTITFLGEKGYEVYKTGNFEKILHNSGDYTEWYEKVHELRKTLRDMDQNPNFVESSFLADLSELIEKGQAIKRFSKNFSRSDRLYFLQIFSELEIMELDYNTKRRAREPRKVPFSLLVEGDSGIGKTSMLHVLCVFFAEQNGLRRDSTYIYTKNAFAEFWDNFSTYMHTIILDDIAFMKPDATMGGDPSCMEFLQIVNAVPYVPNQAALENKGKTPLKAELVIGTTNTRHLNAHHYFSCPSAAQRRFPYIVTAKVRPEYRHEGAVTLDSTKVPTLKPNELPDYWMWNVSTIKPVAGTAVDRRRKLGIETKILKDVPMSDFLIWYKKAIAEHNASQHKMLTSLNQLKDITFCSCGMPYSMCQCNVQTFSERMNDTRIMFKMWSSIGLCISVIWYMRDSILSFLVNRLWGTFWVRLMHYFYIDRYRHVHPRVFLNYLGNRAQATLARPRNLVLIVSIATACLVVYKMCKGYTDIQSFTEAHGKTCSTKTEDEREDIWYKSDYSLTAYDMLPASLSSHGLTRDDFQRMIGRNIIRINVAAGPHIHKNNAFCVYGHIYAVNRHFIEMGLNHLFEIIQSADTTGINGNVKTCLTEKDVLFFDETNDLAFVQILCLPPKKDLRKYLIKDSFEAKAPGFLQVRDFDGKLSVNNFKGCEHLNDVRFPKCNINMERGIEMKSGDLTKYGDCGAPLVLESELGFVIAGMHCILADKSRPISLRFTEDDIRACEKHFGNTISESYPRLQSETASFDLGDLSKRSVVRFAETGSAYVYGSTEKFRTKPKTRVEPTMLSERFKELGFMPKVTKPVMKGWEPWRNGLLDMVKCDSPIRTDILDIVKESFKKEILRSIDMEMLEEQVHILTDFETINGAAGVKYIDKINRNTSAGPPWNKSKKYMMHAIPPIGETLDPVDLNDELKDRINEAIECYKRGERYHFLYKAHLKDEPISFAKAEAKKTRIFCGASIDSTFITRKYYLAAVRFIQNNRYTFENAVGINVDSIEWDDVYQYLTCFGTDGIIAGDFSAYDKTMKAVFLHAVFDILDWLLMLSGNFKDTDKNVLYGIREDLIYSTTDFNGDLIEFFGKNPSGNALTVILNGLVNCLYNRYAYYLLNPENECESFKENVRLMVYGDDNIMGVNVDYAPWFNHTSLVFAYEKMGIRYTMAEKTAKSVPYIKITEATFLKRYFRYDDVLECQLAPIEFQSIADSLTMWVRSKSITREQQMLEIMSGALLKFFHFGEKTYKKWYKIFKEIVETTDLKDFEIEAHIKSYSDMVWSFQERRRKLTPYLSYQPLEE